MGERAWLIPCEVCGAPDMETCGCWELVEEIEVDDDEIDDIVGRMPPHYVALGGDDAM